MLASGVVTPLPKLYSSWRPRLVVVGWLVVCLAPIWVSLGDHALHGRSESRYAVVARNMVRTGNWVVPWFAGTVQLQKPPFTAWCESACIVLLGPTELAVRLPSAVCGSLTLVLLFLFAQRVAGRRMAFLASGLLAVMPLPVVMSRLTLTDGPLALFWWGALAAGCLAVGEGEGGEERGARSVRRREGRRAKNKKRPNDRRDHSLLSPLSSLFALRSSLFSSRSWALLLWLAVALGWLVKGPLALVPVGLLLLWLALAGRWGERRKLHLGWGLGLSVLPFAVWSAVILWQYPAAAQLWWRELWSRATGHGDHNQPIYYFLPIFLGGLFPVSAMLAFPGLNYPWRRIGPFFRSGALAALWVLATVVPLVMFSLVKGKLPPYLLPLGPPMALLGAAVIEDWLTGRSDQPAPGHRPPDVRISLAVILVIFAVVGAAAWGIPTPELTRMLERGQSWILALIHRQQPLVDDVADHVALLGAVRGTLPALVLPILAGAGAAVGTAWAWRRRPGWRGAGLALVWLAGVAMWLGAWRLEDPILRLTGSRELLREVQRVTRLDQPRVVSYRYFEQDLPFYLNTDAPRLDVAPDLRAELAVYARELVVLAAPEHWEQLQRTDPALAEQFVTVLAWPRPPLPAERWVLRPLGRQEKSEERGAKSERGSAGGR